MKKKILTIFMATCLALSMFTISFAGTNSDNECKLIPGEENSVEITYNEYIDLMAKANNISKNEAIAMDKQDTANKIATINNKNNLLSKSSAGTKYFKASKTFTYSENNKFKAKSEATIKLVGAGSMYEISDVTAVWTVGDKGTYDWEWKQLSAWTSGMTKLKVDIGGSGVFVIKTDVSGGAGASVRGFTFSGQVGTHNTYTSNTMQMSWTWRNNTGQ